MKILVTGNMGYVGPVLIRKIRDEWRDSEIIGFDSGYYAQCVTNASFPELFLNNQYFGDVRNFPEELLVGVDALIHLAAISNDPIGNRFAKPTEEINFKATLDIAHKAIKHGVKSFVFASSCSMYGQTKGGARRETDPLNPLTAYAKSKVFTEQSLQKIRNDQTNITSLRFATACGMSPRLRLDLVLNDFVACAVSTKKITVLSDGSPWRPLIDVSDMARAIIWAIQRESNKGGDFLAVNAGSDEWNYQVNDLANQVAKLIPGTEVEINKKAQPDKRSYKVDFSLFKKLALDHQPIKKLDTTILNLKNSLEELNFCDSNFRSSTFMRLKVLESHLEKGILNDSLRWDFHD